jgi:hypothetical protein
MEVQLSSAQDIFRWNLTASGEFSVKSMYLDFMNSNTIFLKRYIWKIKVPLKIRIFMWFLHRKFILTKDNLLKRNWQGNSSCVFCDKDESIKHLFFECPLAKIIWRVVHMAFGIPPPRNVTNMFGNWLTGLDKHEVKNIRIGACAIVWALWNTRNGYPNGYALDPYVVLSSTIGAAGCHGFWVQPFGDGRTGLIQPIRLAA